MPSDKTSQPLDAFRRRRPCSNENLNLGELLVHTARRVREHPESLQTIDQLQPCVVPNDHGHKGNGEGGGGGHGMAVRHLVYAEVGQLLPILLEPKHALCANYLSAAGTRFCSQKCRRPLVSEQVYSSKPILVCLWMPFLRQQQCSQV